MFRGNMHEECLKIANSGFVYHQNLKQNYVFMVRNNTHEVIMEWSCAVSRYSSLASLSIDRRSTRIKEFCF